MKRITFNLLAIFLLLVMLSGCAADIKADVSGGESTNIPDDGSADISQAEVNGAFEMTPFAGSGTLHYTVENVYLVENLYDEGIPLEELDIDASAQVGTGETLRLYSCGQNYEFMDTETGQLVDGVYLVAVELTVTNVDASSERYVSIPLGVETGPDDEAAYVFRADDLYIYDTSRKNINPPPVSIRDDSPGGNSSGGSFRSEHSIGSFAWFTGCGQRKESACAFYLPIGETTRMTVYYLVGECKGDTLSSLGLSTDLTLDEEPDILCYLSLE